MRSPVNALIGSILVVLVFPKVFAQQERAPGKDPESLRQAALEIDKHIAAFYKKQKLPVPSVADDATFLRRAFLVANGRIPTAEVALTFIEIDDDSKRGELVGYLMGSQGYSSHLTNWAFDLLRLRDNRQGSQANNEPYRNWIRKAMDDNMPWDDFVTSLVGGSGNGWDPETASVGYYTIDRGMPLDNLSNTMRIFLGSRMDFYHLAAFTNGQYRKNERHMRGIWQEFQSDETNRGEEYHIAQLFWDRIYGMSLSGGGKGRIDLPSDYQYRDGDPGELVGAKTPFGKTVRMSNRKDEGDGREQFADWIVTRTGEQFPAVIANRMWERIMGKGIYEPVDVYTEPSKTVYPKLMGHLAQLMADLDYDLRAFQHVLMLTKTFQFATNPNPSV